MTPEDFREMWDRFEGNCWICMEPFAKDSDAHIDHDHTCCPGGESQKCGECTRGLLCGRCNKGIGLLREDPVILQAAIDYLVYPIEC